MADSETRVEKINVLGPDLLEYRYTFVNAELDDFDVEKFVSTTRPKVEEYYHTNEQFKVLRDSSISIQFSYFDKNGKLISSIITSPRGASNQKIQGTPKDGGI